MFITTFIEVFCFAAQSGEQVWRGPAMDGIHGQPAVHDDRVVVNTSGFQRVEPQLRAFRTSDGTELWSYETGAASDSTPAVGDGTVYISSADGLHAIDLASGEEAFLVADVATEQSSPVVDNNTVFAIAHNHSEDREELVALATADGTEQWRVTVGSDSPPVVTDDAVYAQVDGDIAELDRADGSVRTSGSRQAAPVGLVGDVLYAVDDGTVRAFDSTSGLDQLWAVSTEEVQISDTVGQAVYHVTPVDGAVYVSARDAFYGIGPVEQ